MATDVFGLVGDITNVSNDLLALYNNLVTMGIITPAPDYVAPVITPVTPVAPVAPVAAKEPFYENKWFFPTIMVGTLAGGIGFLAWAFKHKA